MNTDVSSRSNRIYWYIQKIVLEDEYQTLFTSRQWTNAKGSITFIEKEAENATKTLTTIWIFSLFHIFYHYKKNLVVRDFYLNTLTILYGFTGVVRAKICEHLNCTGKKYENTDFETACFWVLCGTSC